MTSDHPTGTDRIGEVASRCQGEIILNLQGDEPLLEVGDVDALIGAMLDDSDLDMATCAHRFADEASWRDPNNVKVIRDAADQALYFSRAPIPGTFPGSKVMAHTMALRHVGIYGFRRCALERFLALERTPLEISEGLEQLRALENGMRIKVLEIGAAPIGVDTPADLDLVRKLWRQQKRS
jgi:3-deoxy-manno-octulosonate cytidylyltransferase (CMP-KDO synthetase)